MALTQRTVSLEKDVIPHLGLPKVPDDLIRRLGKYLQTASRLYALNLPASTNGAVRSTATLHSSHGADDTPQKEARFEGDFDRQARGRVHGTTAEVLELGRERFAYWCFEMLFLLSSDLDLGAAFLCALSYTGTD